MDLKEKEEELQLNNTGDRKRFNKEDSKGTLNQLRKDPNVDLLTKLWGNLFKNESVIYRIGTYPIKDKINCLPKEVAMRAEKSPEIRKALEAVESIKGYSFNTILVLKADATDKPGYVRINDSIDMPLADLNPGDEQNFFFDKEVAIREWKRRCDNTLELGKDIARIAESTISYIRDVIDNNRH